MILVGERCGERVGRSRCYSLVSGRVGLLPRPRPSPAAHCRSFGLARRGQRRVDHVSWDWWVPGFTARRSQIVEGSISPVGSTHLPQSRQKF